MSWQWIYSTCNKVLQAVANYSDTKLHGSQCSIVPEVLLTDATNSQFSTREVPLVEVLELHEEQVNSRL